MVKGRIAAACAIVIVIGPAVVSGTNSAHADHRCDPVSDPGWRVVATHELITEVDGAPYQAGGNWFIDRTATALPFCNYFDDIGNYSLRSYSLSPRTTKEKISICQSTASGGSVAVPPYGGPCPPK